MVVKIQVEFWVVTPRSVVVGYQHFRGPHWLHPPKHWHPTATLIWHHKPEDLNLKYIYFSLCIHRPSFLLATDTISLLFFMILCFCPINLYYQERPFTPSKWHVLGQRWKAVV